MTEYNGTLSVFSKKKIISFIVLYGNILGYVPY